ncbi:hypothetical protein [Mucilaginibacter pedocola]|nr:hypothetical protein [Mucilaginibacter pedocola]
MKKYILSAIAITTLLFSACKKDNDNKPGDNVTGNYQPLTTGSTWSYRNEGIALGEGEAEVDTTVNTMTATTKVFNGKTFRELKSVSGTETTNSYFGIDNHFYYNHTVVDAANAELELPYLNDEKAVNDSWTVPVVIEEAPESQIKGTIVEKGISKTILGKTYNNIIHTKLELQSKDEGQYVTVFTFDFYVAKNIGVVGVYTSYDGAQLSKSELISHNIK